jgi:hypothetical protein
MFKGIKEEGKIGELGSFEAAVNPDFSADAKAGIGFQQDVFKAVPGALRVNLKAEVEIDAEPLDLAIYGLNQSSNPIAKFIGTQVAALKAGLAPHPAIEAAAAEHAAAQAAAAPAAQ